MTIKEYLNQSKSNIQPVLADHLDRQANELRNQFWANDVLGRLKNFADQGKMVRGGLVCLAAQMYGRPVDRDVLNVAAGLELFHAGLLIHDDILDHDQLRRGQPTMTAQYTALNQGKTDDPEDVGTGLAMCVGDISFLLGYPLITSGADVAVAQKLGQELSRELTRVVLAQMDDVALASSRDIAVTEEQIWSVYRHKTAGYTFCLPLKLGAMLAGQSTTTIQQLEQFGQALGLMFQLKDDELGIYGLTEHTGKPVGADIREGKKTMYFYHLFEQASPTDTEQLAHIFGNNAATQADIDMVMQKLDHYGVDQLVLAKMTELEEQAKKALTGLQIDQDHRLLLEDLIDYSLTRTS